MPAHRKDYDLAVSMYNDGLSIEEVARHYGVSRQSMWKSLKRRGVTPRSRIRNGEDNHFYRGGAVAVKFSLSKYVARGVLTPRPCEKCGLPPEIVNGRQRIHGHHDDYNALLTVRWLCKKHHDEWHAINRPVPRRSDWTPTPRAVIASMGGRASRKKPCRPD